MAQSWIVAVVCRQAINGEPEHIRPGIVTDRIEVLQFLANAPVIERGHQDDFLVTSRCNDPTAIGSGQA